jgi:hypothetical protein
MMDKEGMYIRTIAVEKRSSEYVNEEHDTILIDNIPLDEILAKLYPEGQYAGLVPVIVNWLNTRAEQELVRRRYLSVCTPEILPILMCPDDCDLWCTLVVAEVVIYEDYVAWNRIGTDKSDLIKGYDVIGSEVEWLTNVPAMKFLKEDYYKALDPIYFIDESLNWL